METDRPVIHCLVARMDGPRRIVGEGPDARRDRVPLDGVWPKLVTLDEASELYKLGGYAVMVDPESEIELATWEREQRTLNRWGWGV